MIHRWSHPPHDDPITSESYHPPRSRSFKSLGADLIQNINKQSWVLGSLPLVFPSQSLGILSSAKQLISTGVLLGLSPSARVSFSFSSYSVDFEISVYFHWLSMKPWTPKFILPAQISFLSFRSIFAAAYFIFSLGCLILVKLSLSPPPLTHGPSNVSYPFKYPLTSLVVFAGFLESCLPFIISVKPLPKPSPPASGMCHTRVLFSPCSQLTF